MYEHEFFGYGDDKVMGKPCPVRASGRDVSGDALLLAERFDGIARDCEGSGDGTIEADRAERYWDMMMDKLRREESLDADHLLSLADRIHEDVF